MLFSERQTLHSELSSSLDIVNAMLENLNEDARRSGISEPYGFIDSQGQRSTLYLAKSNLLLALSNLEKGS